MIGPTPETDAAQHEGLLRGNSMPTQVVTANFARKLERERDEVREERDKLQIMRNEVVAANKGAKINALVSNSLAGKLNKAERERDEAREALASREVVIAQQNVITDLILERNAARECAEELSDIASKHLSFLLAITPIKTNEKHEKETEKVIDALKRWKKL